MGTGEHAHLPSQNFKRMQEFDPPDSHTGECIHRMSKAYVKCADVFVEG
jgi:hypothetical protein